MMAKAASPVRLEKELMQAAALAGSTLHRSAAEQIEYWADLGRKVAKVLTPDDLLAVSAGLARISLQANSGEPLDVDSVFATLEEQRESGALSEAIQSNSVRYQASSSNPGLLEQVHPDGSVLLGQFANGQFVVRQ